MIEELTTLEKAALLSGKNVWESRDLPRHGIASFFMADGPHGVRKQVGSGDHLGLNASEPATCFPTSATAAGSGLPVQPERARAAMPAKAMIRTEVRFIERRPSSRAGEPSSLSPR